MFSKVGKTLVPRATTFVARRGFQHETHVSGAPRVKISPQEKAVHAVCIFFGLVSYPAWVLVSAQEWQKKTED